MGRASRSKREIKHSRGSASDLFLLTDYFVGFFDVLGQSTKLQELKQVPVNDAERQQAVAILKQTVGVVLNVRRTFNEFFHTAGRPTSFARSLPAPTRRHVAAATAARVMYWGVSDSMIVAVPLMERTNPTLAVNGVRQSLIAAAGMWLLWLSAGHPIRGGVDVGLGMQIADNEVYGSALDSAYFLERKVAGCPRIVVGSTCISYLEFIRARPVTDHLSQIAHHAADESLSMLYRDEDGQMIVDALGPVMRELSRTATEVGGSDGDLRSAVASAHAVAERQLADARAAKNEVLVRRYEHVLRYFDAKSSDW